MTAEATPREDFAAILRLIEERSGLVLRATRWAEFEAAVADSVASTGSRSVWGYLDRLRAEPSVFDAFIVKLLIGETYFFREPNQIRELRERIIPELGARRAGPLRVWSAGCSTGEEAYSLAILFLQAGLGDRTEIVGTDLSHRAIEVAQRGVYRRWSFRGVDDATRDRYFRRRDDAFEVKEEVRRCVKFARHNLVADAYPAGVPGGAPMDLILCRNVLFYFSRERASVVGERLLSCLAPGGVLVAGPSDPMLRCDPPIEALVTPGGLFYRYGPGRDGSRSPDRERRREPAAWSAPPSLRAPAPPSPPLSPAPPIADIPPFPLSADVLTRSAPGTSRVEASDVAGAEDALLAFAAGDYERAVELTRQWTTPRAAVLRVRALANARGTLAAADECENLLEAHGFDVELTYLHATLLLDLGRTEDAYREARKVVYLDRSLEIGHFLMATIALRRGDLASAGRAFRHAHRIAVARRPDEAVPLGDGQRAGALTAVARDWLDRCERPA